jgi:hypothetical protein
VASGTYKCVLPEHANLKRSWTWLYLWCWVQALRAARDIEPGEQLVISYVDQDLPLSARQQLLSTGYGFMCKCQKCKEELSSQSA